MRGFIFLSLCLTAVSASSVNIKSERIVGGSLTTIDNYPTMAALLQAVDAVNYSQDCGGSILNQRSILTAAHCFLYSSTATYRVRVGSTWANSGGVVHSAESFIIHPNYGTLPVDSDIAILRTATFISYNDVIKPASIAGPNYIVADNQSVWAAGWGLIASGGQSSEQLRHVQMWAINQALCGEKFPGYITDNMLCAGHLNVGGISQCQGDSGGPLYHQGVVVGVCSFTGIICGDANTASVNVRVSRFTSWIEANA